MECRLLMKNQSIKLITYSMSLLLALYGGIINIPSLKAQTSNDRSSKKMSANNNKVLVQSKNWKNIQFYWKKLSSLERTKDYNANYEQIQKLQVQLESILKDVDNLKLQHLLTKEQCEYLKTFLQARLHYLEFSLGAVKCYKMSLLGSQIAQTRGDLEQRYDTLEKLFKEDKIDQKTFELTKNKILEDIKFIDDNSSADPKSHMDESITELIILLSK